MFDVIQLRAFLTPFGHVAWTAIAAGALWRVKDDKSFSLSMLFDGGFLKTMIIPIILHMTWDSPFSSPFDLHLIGLGIVGWFVVFGLAQQGLRQIRDEQFQISQAHAIKAALIPAPQLVHPTLPIPGGKIAEA